MFKQGTAKQWVWISSALLPKKPTPGSSYANLLFGGDSSLSPFLPWVTLCPWFLHKRRLADQGLSPLHESLHSGTSRNEGKDVSTSRLPKTCKRKGGTQFNCIPGNVDVSIGTQQALHFKVIRREFLNAGLHSNPFSIVQPLGFRLPMHSQLPRVWIKNCREGKR